MYEERRQTEVNHLTFNLKKLKKEKQIKFKGSREKKKLKQKSVKGKTNI